jgi:hypothetical protein
MTDRDPDHPTPPPPTEPPSPFDRPSPQVGAPASPFDTPQGAARKPGTGVAKPLLIGCGCLVLLGIVAIAALAYFWADFLAFAFESSRPAVELRLPEDLDDARRARFDAAYDGAVRTIKAGDADTLAIQVPLSRLQEINAMPAGERLSAEEVDRLTEQLERLAAVGGGAPPASDPTSGEEP